MRPGIETTGAECTARPVGVVTPEAGAEAWGVPLAGLAPLALLFAFQMGTTPAIEAGLGPPSSGKRSCEPVSMALDSRAFCFPAALADRGLDSVVEGSAV